MEEQLVSANRRCCGGGDSGERSAVAEHWCRPALGRVAQLKMNNFSYGKHRFK